MLLLEFSLKNDHNYRITDVFKKADKSSVLLHYTFMVLVLPQHCVKSVQIRSYFWSVFSLNTGKYGPEKAPYLDTFQIVQLTINVGRFIANLSLNLDLQG